MRKLVATLAFSSVAVIGIEKANDFAVLDAMYAITSEYMTDPPADDRPDRVLLSIKGKGAKDIFDAMPGLGNSVDCAGAPAPSEVTKTAGGLECTAIKAKEYYSCTVAIMLDSGKTARGYICD